MSTTLMHYQMNPTQLSALSGFLREHWPSMPTTPNWFDPINYRDYKMLKAPSEAEGSHVKVGYVPTAQDTDTALFAVTLVLVGRDEELEPKLEHLFGETWHTHKYQRPIKPAPLYNPDTQTPIQPVRTQPQPKARTLGQWVRDLLNIKDRP